MTRPPIVFVGIAPGNARYGRLDASIRKLERWATALDILHYGFVNCVPYHFGPGYKRAMVDYDWLRACTRDQTVVALGRFASDALTRIGVEHFVLPHPSGLNRQLNDPAFLPAALERCRGWLEDR